MSQLEKYESQTVNHLLGRLCTHELKDVLKDKLGSDVFVRGRCEKIRPYKDSLIYADLVDTQANTKIQIRCDATENLVEGSYLFFKGYILLKPVNHYDLINITLVGAPVGEWQPPEVTEETHKSLSDLKCSRVLFQSWYDNANIDKLLIVGSGTGIKDVSSQIPNQRLCTVKINVGDKARFCREIKKAVNSNPECNAMLIARGGDLHTIRMFDDAELVKDVLELKLPFYTAIGHSDQPVLLQQYADQPFHTPTDAGKYIQSCVVNRNKYEQVKADNQQLQQEGDILEQEKEQIITLKEQDALAHESQLKDMKSNATEQLNKKDKILRYWQAATAVSMLAAVGLVGYLFS